MAYRVAAMQYHPDKNTSAEATMLFQRIGEALRVLSDEGLRAMYDRRLNDPEEPGVHDELLPHDAAINTFEKFFGGKSFDATANSLTSGCLVQVAGTRDERLNGEFGEAMAWDASKERWNINIDGRLVALKCRNLLWSGQTVAIHSLKAVELNGAQGVNERFNSDSGRWEVRLQSGESKAIKHTNLVLCGAPDSRGSTPPFPQAHTEAPIPPPPQPHPEAAARPPRTHRVPEPKGQSSTSVGLPDHLASQLVSLMECKIDREVAFKAIGASDGELRVQAEAFLRRHFTPPKECPTDSKPLLVKGQENILPVFQYPPVLSSNEPPGRVYTFLVVGETGSGKTTLLDAFTNVLSGQRFNDKFRWKLVDENHLSSKEAGSSQTSDVNYYYVWDERDGQRRSHVRIIDTPGFGDTSGMDMDEQIVRKFQQLFSSGEIPDLDYVLVVVKASDTRDVPRVAYIHNRIQELFGRDAVGRFIVMCTFADGGPPVCLKNLANHLEWQECFKFNNSALYVDPSEGGE